MHSQYETHIGGTKYEEQVFEYKGGLHSPIWNVLRLITGIFLQAVPNACPRLIPYAYGEMAKLMGIDS
jgi:hypothetical protein